MQKFSEKIEKVRKMYQGVYLYPAVSEEIRALAKKFHCSLNEMMTVLLTEGIQNIKKVLEKES